MKRRTKILLWCSASALFLVGIAAVLWVRHFRTYTPAAALLDLRAAAMVRNTDRPAERFLEIRYGPLDVPANRQKAFLDFFELGHIEGLYLLVQRIPGEHKAGAIGGMAEWVSEYRRTMSPDERQALRVYLNSEAGRSQVRRATVEYLKKDVAFRAATAPVISELMSTLAAMDQVNATRP